MPKRLLSRIWRDEKGITGLETAIILIAFVVVAAVFAYTVLSAGLFSTQKSSEAVYSGLKEAQSSLELRGNVVAYKGDANISDSVGKVEFTVSNALKNNQTVDLTPPYTLVAGVPTVSTATNPTTITYSDLAVTVANVPWTLSWVGKHSSDNMLEDNEKAVITVWLHNYNGSAWSDGTSPFLASNYVDTYHTFDLEVKTASGAVLTIERTMPAIIRDITNLN